MIGFDSVPTVETFTKDNLTEVYISCEGRWWSCHIPGYAAGWTTTRWPALRYHSGDSEALGRALRVLADRMDPGGCAVDG